MAGGGFGHFLKAVLADVNRVHLLRSAAALAYFALFALPPILLVLLALAGRIYGEESARSHLVENVRVHLGKQVGATVEAVVENAEHPGTQERIAMLLSYAILVFTATAGFSHLQSILNEVWEADRRRRRMGWLLHLGKRLFSFVLVVASSLVLLGAVGYSVVLRAIPERLAGLLPGNTGTALLHLYDDLGFLVVGFLGFSLVFRPLPDAHVRGRAAAWGALFTTILLVVGKYALGIYVTHGWQEVAFGAAGSLVATLFALYVGAAIVILGAIVGHVLAVAERA